MMERIAIRLAAGAIALLAIIPITVATVLALTEARGTAAIGGEWFALTLLWAAIYWATGNAIYHIRDARRRRRARQRILDTIRRGEETWAEEQDAPKAA